MEPIPRNKEFYRAARQLIADEKHWTQSALARDRSGYLVPANDPEAVCWCIVGACCKIAGPDPNYIGETAWRLFFPELCDIVPFPEDINDKGTHADVLYLLEQAEARAEV
jgi:hypothetical protein